MLDTIDARHAVLACTQPHPTVARQGTCSKPPHYETWLNYLIIRAPKWFHGTPAYRRTGLFLASAQILVTRGRLAAQIIDDLLEPLEHGVVRHTEFRDRFEQGQRGPQLP